MMQPGRANVGAAMIAHGAASAVAAPQRSGCPGAADVQFGVVMTVGIAAIDEHVATAVGSHVGQPHGVIVKHQVRDRPGHAALKRGLSGNTLVSGPAVSRGHNVPAIDAA
jgi:hypothetical protein